MSTYSLLLACLFGSIFIINQSNGQAMSAADSIILIKPEELRIIPKSALQEKIKLETGEEVKLQTKLDDLAVKENGFEVEQHRQHEDKEEDRVAKEEAERKHSEEEARWREHQLLLKKKSEELFKAYIAVGTVRLLFDNTTEPFTLFYDSETERSRVDLGNRGLVRSLQLAKDKLMYRIEFPTAESASQRPICIEMRGTDKKTVKALPAIPDLKHFQRESEETIGTKKVDKWKYELLDEKRKSHHTFWLFTELETKKPIRLDVLTKVEKTNKVIDHYVIEYKYFFATRPSDDVFKKPVDVECRSIVGVTEADEDKKDKKDERKADERHTSRSEFDRERLHMNPLASLIDPQQHLEYDDELDKVFEDYRRRFVKKYESDDEYILRRAAFCHNYRYINLLNRAGLSFRLRINHLADRTNDELRRLLGVRGATNLESSTHKVLFDSKRHNIRGLDQIPDEVDWRLLGAVTKVSDQAQCGSDWAIASTRVIESALFLRSNRYIKLSSQELLDCSEETGNEDCKQGNPWQAFEYALKNGLSAEVAYGSLTNRKSECRRDVPFSAKIKNWVLVSNKEQELKKAIAMNGPVALVLDAAHKSFIFYSSGIYRELNCRKEAKDVNHAVVAIGFGKLSTSKKEYFLIENSFSEKWGLGGYMMIEANDSNQCGMLSAPTFVDM
jgi:hypothetical protein